MDATERRRRAAEEAAGWWVTLQVDEVPEFQRREFVDWLRESPVHIAEILRVAQVHGALERFERWAHVPQPNEIGCGERGRWLDTDRVTISPHRKPARSKISQQDHGIEVGSIAERAVGHRWGDGGIHAQNTSPLFNSGRPANSAERRTQAS